MVKVLLIVVQGKPEGKTIPITVPVFRIGRGVDCHLRPNSEEVSRTHTEITLTDTEAIVRDLGSRNGTFVNGQLLSEPHKLTSGELLKVGPLTFAVAIQGEAESSAAVSTPPTDSGASKLQNLNELPADKIDAWLVAGQNKPTPDRPSGVYSGDTLTLDSFKQGQGTGSSGTIPSIPEQPTISPLEAHIAGIEMLPEGYGDGGLEPGPADDEEKTEDVTEDGEDEIADVNNPFYKPKNAPVAAEPVAEAAQASKDSSEAANDILKKMFDRRRPR